MTTTQRPRTPRSSAPPPGPNPMNRGLILIAVGVVLAVILLVKGGGVGFDSSKSNVEIGAGEEKATTTTTTASTTTTTAEKAPQTVQVVAANGSGVTGMAAKTATVLAQSGYTQVVATDSLQPVTTSTVLYASGYDGNAKSIAKSLGLAESSVQPLAAGTTVAKNQPANSGVVIQIGPDLAKTLGGTTATTTTVAGGATTTSIAGRTTTTIAGVTTTTSASKTTTTKSSN